VITGTGRRSLSRYDDALTYKRALAPEENDAAKIRAQMKSSTSSAAASAAPC
jgi:hypothetical protein